MVGYTFVTNQYYQTCNIASSIESQIVRNEDGRNA